MTWEEAERMMAFIREQQARINAAMARLDKRFKGPAGKVDQQVDLQVDRTAERAWAFLATAKHQRRMRKFDERLNVLLDIVERHISKGWNGKR